jgi:ABC-type tungstate transport system substrate-binding protein
MIMQAMSLEFAYVVSLVLSMSAVTLINHEPKGWWFTLFVTFLAVVPVVNIGVIIYAVICYRRWSIHRHH